MICIEKESITPSCHKKIASRLNLHVLPKIGKIPLYKIFAVETIDETLDVKTETFNFVEIFHKPIRLNNNKRDVSPVKFAENYFSRIESVQ